MKLKRDANGNVVCNEAGFPVYVKDDGSEVAYDAAATVQKIGQLNTESKQHRERAEAAETKTAELATALKVFEGIEPEAAKKALTTMKNLDDKKLVDAGQVEVLKQQMAQGYEAKLKEEKDRGDKLEGELVAEKIGGSFSRSKYIGEKLAVPSDMAQATFGKHFKLVDGKVVAYDSDGKTVIPSTARPGEPADFDEAMAFLVGRYPHKDAILRADQKPGSGAPTGNPGTGGTKSVTRAAFAAMTPQAQMDHATKGGSVAD